MGKKTNLKALLSDFQEKQRKAQLQKAKEAAKKDVLKKKNSGRLSANSKGKRPETMPFFPSDTILLIGEGNFSFARAFFTSEHEALTHLPPANVTATTYDSEETCYEKYPDAKQIVHELREKGVAVLFEVDARKLSSHKELKKRKWKRIVWNFPHAGKGISDQDRNILSNQVLLLDFLKSAAPLLEGGAIPSMSSRNSQMKKKTLTGSDDEGDDMVVDMAPTQMKERGTILITLRNGHPYTLWDLPRLAKKPPESGVSSVSPLMRQPKFIQLRSFAFMPEIWKGYEHRMTKGWVEGITRGHRGQQIEDRTWEFCLADSENE